MGEVTRYPDGTFCWIELVTRDADAAGDFYAELFGWALDEPSVSDRDSFTLCRLGGNPVAGIRQSADHAPGWLSFISVDDVESSATRVERLGGTISVGPQETSSGSRLAVAGDPAGAPFVLWHSESFPGARWVNEVDTWSWNELVTGDMDAAAAFYTELFGWSAIEAPPLDVATTGRRVLFGRGELLIAGVRTPTDLDPAEPGWTVRFRVADVEAAADRIGRRGGRILLPPTHVPLGMYALVADPLGDPFSLIAAPAGGVQGLDKVGAL